MLVQMVHYKVIMHFDKLVSHFNNKSQLTVTMTSEFGRMNDSCKEIVAELFACWVIFLPF